MNFRREFVVSACLLASIAMASCSTSDGSTLGQNSTPTIRQLDDNGGKLPFETTHDLRWNAANDGTSYEPCTALEANEVDSLGWISRSVKDAAGTNGQTLRGCTWRGGSPESTDHWMLSQFVGNSTSLTRAKTRRPDSSSTEWLPDTDIDHRSVGLMTYRGAGRCETYVQSNKAGVYTAVSAISTDQPPISEICDRALAFTRATIGKMPA